MNRLIFADAEILIAVVCYEEIVRKLDKTRLFAPTVIEIALFD